MPHSFLPLSDPRELDAALARAAHEPVVLFKHSPTCGVSAQAHEELQDLIASRPSAPPVYLVSVRTHRPVAMAIAERFGIRHESPQVLVVAGGAVRWHGSHFRVNGRELQAALDRLDGPAHR